VCGDADEGGERGVVFVVSFFQSNSDFFNDSVNFSSYSDLV
jgi:hypothetical protein